MRDAFDAAATMIRQSQALSLFKTHTNSPSFSKHNYTILAWRDVITPYFFYFSKIYG